MTGTVWTEDALLKQLWELGKKNWRVDGWWVFGRGEKDEVHTPITKNFFRQNLCSNNTVITIDVLVLCAQHRRNSRLSLWQVIRNWRRKRKGIFLKSSTSYLGRIFFLLTFFALQSTDYPRWIIFSFFLFVEFAPVPAPTTTVRYSLRRRCIPPFLARSFPPPPFFFAVLGTSSLRWFPVLPLCTGPFRFLSLSRYSTSCTFSAAFVDCCPPAFLAWLARFQRCRDVPHVLTWSLFYFIFMWFLSYLFSFYFLYKLEGHFTNIHSCVFFNCK